MAIVELATLTEFYQNNLGKAEDDEIANFLFFPGAPLNGLLKERNLVGQGGITATFPKYNTIAARNVTEGADITETQALDPTATTITASESASMTEVTDLSQKVIMGPNGAAAYMTDLGRNHAHGMFAKFDTDVLALNPSLDDGVTNTGVNLTNANLLEVVRKLDTGNVPQPWVGVIHPRQYSDLVAEPESPFREMAAAGRKAEELYENYFIGRLYGVNWYVNSRVPSTNSGADYAGAVLSTRCYGVVWVDMPESRTQRDESKRANEFIYLATYGVGEVDGTMGMYLISDL